eukprot:3896181-Amphidinium_carterae.1
MSGDKLVVDNTPDRSTLFEAHTPQVMRAELLRKGFDFVNEKKLEVTDDASIAEALGEEVTLTVGEYTNLKFPTSVNNAVLESYFAALYINELHLLVGVESGGLSPALLCFVYVKDCLNANNRNHAHIGSRQGQTVRA